MLARSWEASDKQTAVSKVIELEVFGSIWLGGLDRLFERLASFPWMSPFRLGRNQPSVFLGAAVASAATTALGGKPDSSLPSGDYTHAGFVIAFVVCLTSRTALMSERGGSGPWPGLGTRTQLLQPTFCPSEAANERTSSKSSAPKEKIPANSKETSNDSGFLLLWSSDFPLSWENKAEEPDRLEQPRR